MVKMTKAERRAKLKKSKKEAKKLGKETAKTEEVQPTQQEAALAEVKEDLTAEEAFETKKRKLAELGMALLADPEANTRSLKEMLQFTKDGDISIVKLGLLSLLAVFKDIIPGYRIRLPTEKELEMNVSKEVKKMRFYESTLLSAYKGYLQKLLVLEKQPIFHHVVVRCVCTLLDAVPHFNFRESLLVAVVRNIGSSDDVVRKLCCSTIKSLVTNEGKHGGEATVEAVRLIADHVKAHDCQLHPDSVEWICGTCSASSLLEWFREVSRLIDLDYIGDLMNYLKRLAARGSNSDGSAQIVQSLTVSERLRCCIVAFKVMRSNLNALNVDLQDFFVQLYNLALEYRPGSYQGEVLAETLMIFFKYSSLNNFIYLMHMSKNKIVLYFLYDV
ncbi:NucleOlar Complex associated 3 [Hibiscus trionum]|uniref:NucleOlar Complex associated 3 n=1 Tax=Hibiscus trionum TaxID=183268 RepID=A0A9W7MU48_HIBTR|nr:NucleOlar Complex associated 3 [Hibiscus trionum]